jgi:phosphomannomutase/phosphoglucomutase
MTQIDPSIFRKYDIRGRVPEEFDPASAHRVGQAFGQLMAGFGNTVAVGRDNRLAIQPGDPGSNELANALIDGLVDSGCSIYDLGAVPTPVVYFTVLSQGLDAGIMVTGSHNPRQYNGLKIFRHDRQLNRILAFDTAPVKEYCLAAPPSSRMGSIGSILQAGEDYREAVLDQYAGSIQSRLGQPGRPVRVVIDPGNAVGGVIAPRLLQGLGHQVDTVNGELDGRFPDHVPNPEQVKNLATLSTRVRSTGAEIGVAYDGDADRVGMVGPDGEKISADLILLLLARDLLKRHPGARIVFDGLCTEALVEDIIKNGGFPLRSQTGYTSISKRMFAEGALLAGEISGHIFFRDLGFGGYDDGILASCRLLDLISHAEISFGDMLRNIERWSVMEQKRPPCPEAMKQTVIAQAKEKFLDSGAEIEEVDGLWITYRRKSRAYGRIVIRAASTEDSLSIMCEARTEAERKGLENRIDRALSEVMGPLWQGL